jgi:glutamate formiminotransferase / formiminotetrahydrofolate cyclodeaminase
MKIVECVPNFSEGRRQEVIQEIVQAAKAHRIRIVDIESDADHNRSVLTFVGEPEEVKKAAMSACGKAVQLIDLNHHKGEHPRMGAVDVVPFVPIREVTMEECIELAKEFGREFAERFEVPVFLYEEAATRPDRKNLADIRRGEFEGLREEMGKNPDRSPDYGPEKIHPTAGATAVGARQILIAYNINLNSNDLEIAKQIAHQVRGRDGGLPNVKALGFELKKRGMVQVSMNMVNYKGTPLYKAFELVNSLARSYEVPVVGSEIVGSVPDDALVDCAEFYLKLENFQRENILERKLFEESTSTRLVDLSLVSYSDEVASEKPTPGGGSAASYAGALGAALISMGCRLTLSRKDYEAYHQRASEILAECENLRQGLLGVVDEDAVAFQKVMEALRMPKNNEEEKKVRQEALQSSLKGAAEAPGKSVNYSMEVMRQALKLAEFGNLNVISDIECGFHLAYAAMKGTASNVQINLDSIKDAANVGEKSNWLETCFKEAAELSEQLEKILSARRKK